MSTGAASAQVRDDPPGWAQQWRGIQEERGFHPGEAYGGYGYYGDGVVVGPERYYYGGYGGYWGSPGVGIRNRQIRNERGEH
jgi:hypothetical protein